MDEFHAATIETLMNQTRARTLALFDLLPEEQLRQSPGQGFRPIIWHLAHIGVFEAYWILQRYARESAPDERYERIFDPIKTPREDSVNLPSRDEMQDYLRRVRESSLGVLRDVNFDRDHPLLRDAYLFHLVLEHERQHQETLAYLMQMLDPGDKRRPIATDAAPSGSKRRSDENLSGGMVVIPAGEFEMGVSPGPSFAYDNESPMHVVELPSFKLDRHLTTNGEYLEFVEAGGYARRVWWSDEGWARRERENWQAPLYWGRDGDGGRWFVDRMFDRVEIEPCHPVCGVSWYEAEAYAKFRGKRLPSEAEWEKAASWDAVARRKRRHAWGDDEPSVEKANFGFHFWGTTAVGSFPAGDSPKGVADLTGNVWEWTGDLFRGYPGFVAFPYPEYSEVWFDDDHRVLKGGSWATQPSLLRASFRNFFRRHFRIAFAGIRCAQNV